MKGQCYYPFTTLVLQNSTMILHIESHLSYHFHIVATRPQMACAAVHQCHPWISNADTHSTNGGFITE